MKTGGFMRALLLIMVISASVCAQAKVRVDYRISRIQGLVDFASAIADEPHHAPGIKELFDKSSYNTPEMQKSIEVVKGLRQSFANSFKDSENGTKYRDHNRNVGDLFVIQSIYAKDIQDLSTRTLGLLATAEHLAYFTALKKLEPVYNKLIWRPLSPELTQHKLKLEALSKKAGLEEMFAKAEKFYNAQWPSDTPFVIAIHPIPYIKGFKNSSSSQSLNSVEIHGVIVEPGKHSNDLKGSFGVIFHELCHSLYDAQSDSFKRDFENYFLNNPSPYTLQAYTWFNEAAATAIGNGWAYARANKGVIDKSEWYNNPTISGYGQEIYPLIAEALNKNQTVDENMVKQFIAGYENRFPKAIYAFENLLQRLIVAYDEKTMQEWQTTRLNLKKNFHINSLNMSAPLDHPNTLKAMTEHEDDSLMFIFPNDAKKKLGTVANSLPYVKENLKQIQGLKDRQIYSATADRGRAYVFVRAQNQKEVDEAIAAIVKKEYIDPQAKIWSY